MKAKNDFKQVIAMIADGGDITNLSNSDRRALLAKLTNYLHLNPHTDNFLIFKDQNGRYRLYATKECCAQLRHNLGINIWLSDPIYGPDQKYPLLVSVKANGLNKHNRSGEEIGSVSLVGIPPEEYSNHVMWAVTKAKRRLTLDLSGLGVLADVEVFDIIGHEFINVNEPDKAIDNSDVTNTSLHAADTLMSILKSDKNIT